jgi:hypothetical protein
MENNILEDLPDMRKILSILMFVISVGFVFGEGEIFQVTIETNKSVITSEDHFVISIHIKNITDEQRMLIDDYAENIIDFYEYYLIFYSINENGIYEQILPGGYQYASRDGVDEILLDPFQECVMKINVTVKDVFMYDYFHRYDEDHSRITMIFEEKDLFYPIPDYANKLWVKFIVNSEIENPQNKVFLESNEIELQFLR